MKKQWLFFLIVLPIFAYADTNSYWECHAQDAQKLEWVAQGNYERNALTEALDACKKQSASPTSCRVSQETCELFVNGLTTRPMWRCTALDQLSKVWRSGIYRQRDEAAMAAKARCKKHSAMPDSCYINLMMCKNLNELVS